MASCPAKGRTITPKSSALPTCTNSRARPSQSTTARGPREPPPGHGCRLHAHFAAGLSSVESPTKPRTLVPASPEGDLAQRAPKGLAKAVPQASTTQRFGCFCTPTRGGPPERPLWTLGPPSTGSRRPQQKTAAGTCPGQPCRSRVRQGWCPWHHPPSRGARCVHIYIYIYLFIYL